MSKTNYNFLFRSSLLALLSIVYLASPLKAQENRIGNELSSSDTPLITEKGIEDELAQTGIVIKRLRNQVTDFVLDNGIKVSLYRRKSTAPIFSGVVSVRVGGVDERSGKTGLAHLFEHMAFKGTKEIGTRDFKQEEPLLKIQEKLRNQGSLKTVDSNRLEKVENKLKELWKTEEFSKLLSERGATNLNATTDKDLTNYFESLPNSSFEFWCWIESERMLNPVFRQFYKERDVVIEERRMRFEDDPWGKLYEGLLKVAFLEHPYRHPIVGYRNDLDNLFPEDLRELHNRYYIGRNIAISVVGDINIERAQEQTEYYFGRIPEGLEPERTRQFEPPQTSERYLRLHSDREPRAMIAYHKPVFPDLDDPAITVMGNILAKGSTSRLYSELVEKKRLVADLGYSEGPGMAYPNLFGFLLLPISKVSMNRVLENYNRLIDRFVREGPSDWELRVAKKGLAMEYLEDIDSNLSLAQSLSSAELLFGGWSAFFDWYDEMIKVTKEDIKRVAHLYLDPTNRTIATMDKGNAKTSRKGGAK